MDVAACNTFTHVVPNISNLVRVSRVTGGHVGGPRSRLAMNRRIRTGVATISTSGGHVDLSVHTLLPRRRMARTTTRRIIRGTARRVTRWVCWTVGGRQMVNSFLFGVWYLASGICLPMGS